MTSTPAASPGGRRRVLIAGSGVAAVEAILALRHLAGRHLDIGVVAPSHAFVNRPASVAEPFGFGAPPPLDLGGLAARYGVELIPGELVGVDVASHTARVAAGAEQPYDDLLVAVGARPVEAVQGALTFAGPDDVPAVERLLDEAARGKLPKVAIAIPAATTWPLPAYELAVMATTELRMRGASNVEVILVTPEREPLWLFGPAAGEAMRELLASRDIGLETGTVPVRFSDGLLWLQDGDTIAADTVLALPRFEGPRIQGLPADGHGFLPTDGHGVVAGAPGVFAAGDATSFPLKQGGLATQQADAAAATIAAQLRTGIHPEPFTPVLRGLLLTGGAPLYLRAELDQAGTPRDVTARARALRGEVSTRALWWPPGKIAGRYLAPYLATARPVALLDEPLIDRVATYGPGPAGRQAALELALLLADEEAESGDVAHALLALDAASALSGGVLPATYAAR